MKHTIEPTLGALCLLVGGIAYGQTDPAIVKLEKSLPAGWSLLATDTELVIRHDKPCYAIERQENAPPNAAPMGGGPLVTIELRYRLEPKWSDKQLAAARGANDKVAAELRALAKQYRIDDIHKSKGRPLPSTDDERTRLDAYTKAEAQSRARTTRLPLCTIGESSLLVGDDTYRQLSMKIDPPEAMREAFQIVELVKRQCGASH
jgi:hypothetical protein